MNEQNEKQAIKEMAKILCEDCAKDTTPCVLTDTGKMCESVFEQAEALYKAGYRKQSVGEWVTVGEGITERVVCSNCNSEKGSFMKPPFCNQCGAKKKGGAE